MCTKAHLNVKSVTNTLVKAIKNISRKWYWGAKINFSETDPDNQTDPDKKKQYKISIMMKQAIAKFSAVSSAEPW